MSDHGSLPIGLIQQHMAKPIDPEKLELMGKRAAALFRDSSTSLSQAVVETVKEARLAPEQVKRVCEFANTTAYLEAFEKAGELRNITFDGGPADPSVVLKDLNDGSSPAINQVESSDYSTPSSSYKTSSVNDSLLAEAFNVSSVFDKTAAVEKHSRHADPMEDVNDMRINLEAVRDDLISKLSSAEVVYGDVRQAVCEAAAQAVESGTTLADISRAWADYAPRGDLLKAAMVEVVGHLQSRGHEYEEINDSLKKVASTGVMANPEHPVIQSFAGFAKAAHVKNVLRRGVSVIDEQLSNVRKQLQGMI